MIIKESENLLYFIYKRYNKRALRVHFVVKLQRTLMETFYASDFGPDIWIDWPVVGLINERSR